jgi:hypothetical protein
VERVHEEGHGERESTASHERPDGDDNRVTAYAPSVDHQLVEPLFERGLSDLACRLCRTTCGQTGS